MAAQAPNGEDWCYYIYPNGKRVYTTYWRCCKSSGAMALEELAPAAYSVDADRIAVNLYGPGTAELGGMRITQLTDYPFDGDIRLVLALPEPTTPHAGVAYSILGGGRARVHQRRQPADPGRRRLAGIDARMARRPT